MDINSPSTFEIPGFSDYRITSSGHIFSKRRNLKDHPPGTFHLLKPSITSRGFCYCQLIDDQGRRRHKYNHRLLFEMAWGPIQKGFIVAHEDGDKTNNALINLTLRRRTKKGTVC